MWLTKGDLIKVEMSTGAAGSEGSSDGAFEGRLSLGGRAVLCEARSGRVD